MEKSVEKIVENLTKIDEVEAVLLAGSVASDSEDEHSDYDIYVYTTAAIPVEKRRDAMSPYVEYMEYGNSFWELEDDGRLNGGREIEFIYRSYDWLRNAIEAKLVHHYADVGYSTCFWSNLLNSRILYDRDGRLTALQQSARVAYPHELKANIVAKNYPLLRDAMPAYYFQIKKAIARGDVVSINHRVAAFLASYFDILFAINEMPHPGEKKLVKILLKNASVLPRNFETNISRLLSLAGAANSEVLDCLNEIVDELDEVL